MDLNFRTLRADEIECRVAQVTEKSIGLLLYKDARCDMNILDETVGPMRWQREHSRDNANCKVGIYDPDMDCWVWKEDTGTESNTEAAKGLASDSFKRACFNWGIGRELYTAPRIWVSLNVASKKDRFSVSEIDYEGRKITRLIIVNDSTGETVFTFGKGTKPVKAKAKAASAPAKAPDVPAQPAPEPAVVPVALVDDLVCQRCHGAIQGVKLKNGNLLSPAQLIAYGNTKFPDWERLCAKCQSELYKSRNEEAK